MDERRKVGIADGMILVAGIAAGLGLIRLVSPGITPEVVWGILARPSQGWSFWYAVEIVVELGTLFGIPLLVSWTPACLLIQLLKPRPRWHRLRRRPGFVVCLLPSLVGAIAVVLTAACVWLLIWTPGGASQDPYGRILLVVSTLSGSLVLSSWATMKLCGVWHARPTWVDRLGRMTGVAWVGLGMMSYFYFALSI